MSVRQRCHLFFQDSFQFIVERATIVIFLIILMLQVESHIGAQSEYALGERYRRLTALAVRILFEVFEISAPIEYIEALLVLSTAINIGRKTSAASYHLHKLDFALHHLEEYEIQHIGHIDTGVEHIDRHGYLRVGITNLKPINQILRISDIIVNQRTKFCPIFGIQLVESLHYQLGVTMIAGKYDSLADSLAILHLQTVFHQVLQHGIDGVAVEYIAEYLAAVYIAHILRIVAISGSRLCRHHGT